MFAWKSSQLKGKESVRTEKGVTTQPTWVSVPFCLRLVVMEDWLLTAPQALQRTVVINSPTSRKRGLFSVHRSAFLSARRMWQSKPEYPSLLQVRFQATWTASGFGVGVEAQILPLVV